MSSAGKGPETMSGESTGSPTIVIPPVRTFGRLLKDDWLPAKQREESEELLDAAREWLSDPTDETRIAMLDELADLLQTIANMCAAYHIDERDLADALDRCWEKNMRREQPADGSVESTLIHLGIRPNGKVRDRVTGRTLTVLSSDAWGRRLDVAKVGVYETDWRHTEWLPFTRLEPIEDREGDQKTGEEARMTDRKSVYEWHYALTAFECRWNIPRIAELTDNGHDLVTDGHGNAPITHALEQEPIDLLRERVKACGGNANLIIRHTDGVVSMLAVRKGDELDRYATISDLLRDPPGDVTTLGVDDGMVRPCPRQCK